MASYRKYMFDLDFGHPHPRAAAIQAEPVAEDAPPPEPEPEPEPPPMFSEEDLALARDAAFEEGRQAAIQEVQRQTDRLTANALIALVDQVGTLHRQQEEANDANSRTAVRVAMAVLKKVLPATCETYAFDEVKRVVEQVVSDLLDEPRIIVKVAESLVDPVRDRLEAVCQSHGFEGRVVVQADARLNVGDCRVEWTDGGAERDQTRLLQEVDATIERALAPPERRAESADDFAGT